MGGGEEAHSADEAYEDDTEPFDELPDDDGDGDDDAASGSQGVRRRKGPPAPVDVEQRSSEEPLASAVFDTPAKRQARSLAAVLEGVLEKGVEDRSEKDKAARVVACGVRARGAAQVRGGDLREHPRRAAVRDLTIAAAAAAAVPAAGMRRPTARSALANALIARCDMTPTGRATRRST